MCSSEVPHRGLNGNYGLQTVLIIAPPIFRRPRWANTSSATSGLNLKIAVHSAVTKCFRDLQKCVLSFISLFS